MKKNYQRKSLLFPPLPQEKVNFIKVDKESYKFITPYKTASEIINIISEHIEKMNIPRINSLLSKNSQIVMTDMTAGVGGNCIPFAQHFKYINAIEIDQTRVKYLEDNVKLYELKNVNIYLGNSINYIIDDNSLGQDIIFIDPPWGGDSYKEQDNIKLSLGDYGIEDIIEKIFEQDKAVLVCLKLPTNYDFEYLKSRFSNVILHELRKMYLILIEK